MTTESGKKASRKKLPLRKVVIILIVVCITVAIDAVLFYRMVYTPVTCFIDSSRNSDYDSFPEYSGVVEEIVLAVSPYPLAYTSETYDFIGVVYTGEDKNNRDKDAYKNEFQYENVESIEVGHSSHDSSLKEVLIKVSGEDGEKWFLANAKTYVYESIANERGLADIEVGKNITIAYSSRSDIEDFFSGSGIENYDFVYAVKSEVPQSMYLDVVRTYALSAFLPSVIIAVCTIFFLFWITRNFVWKKPRPIDNNMCDNPDPVLR